MTTPIKVYSLITAVIFVLISCNNDDDTQPTNHITTATDSINADSAVLNGLWHLESVSYGLAGVENYKADSIFWDFDSIENTLTVINNLDSSKYLPYQTVLRAGTYNYEIGTDSIDNWYIIYNVVIIDDSIKLGSYKICNKTLVIDEGMALDKRGYFFSK